MVSDKSMDEASCPAGPLASQAEHGGNLSAARLAYPQAPEPWLDLSTGINPYSYPFGELPPDCFTNLPCPGELRALEEAAAAVYRIPLHAQVVAAPGTQAIINWLPRLIPARRVGILGFTYCEFVRSWATTGAEVTIATEPAALRDQDVAIIVNPNNPDGRLVVKHDLYALAAALDKHGGVLIVDEAFIDFESEKSAISKMPASGMVVLRSFGKTYGLPGLRLGFAIAPKNVAAKLRAAFGPWPVSCAAIAIGTRALPDSKWLAATGKRLKSDIDAIDNILSAAGFAFLGGTPLFRLVRHRDAQRLYERLARAGILARRFDARPGWLRFGILSSAKDRTRLRAALGLGLQGQELKRSRLDDL
jgi:cobalamin biosynthesis protein CobC